MDLARRRYSCRKYKSMPVEKAKLDYILECGRIAPSAANKQPWKIYIIQEKYTLEAIHQSYPREWFYQAPLVMVFCGLHQQSWKRAKDRKDHCDIDVAILVDHITLAATEQGLATCWICAFDSDMVSNLLKLSEDVEPIALLAVGYPDDECDINRHQDKRKSIKEIVTYI